MTTTQLPAGPDGQRILWGAWTRLAECGREMAPRDCRRCGLKTPQDRARGRLLGEAKPRAMAWRCDVCGGLRAVWFDDGPARAIIPLCNGQHTHPITAETPLTYGPCLDCGATYEETT